MDWLLLPAVTESMIEEVTKTAKGHFIGDPSFVYEQNLYFQIETEEEAESNVVSLAMAVNKITIVQWLFLM